MTLTKVEAKLEQSLTDATYAYTKAAVRVSETRAAHTAAEKALERAAVVRIAAFDAIMKRT